MSHRASRHWLTVPLHIALVCVIAGLGLLAAVPVDARQPATSEPEPDVVVCPDCDVSSIAAAIQRAEPGMRIEVRGGEYAEKLVIDRDLELIGVDDPVIDGQGAGTVVSIQGATVTLSGFVIRGTGTSLHHEDSAVLIDSGRGIIENNRIEDALFGLYVKNAPGTVLRGNVVIGKATDVASRGDGIRVWYADGTIIEDNVAQDGRDVILWYSNHSIVRGNQFDRSRYGLHLMFSDSALIEGNSLRESSIGLYVMYSRNVTVARNSLSDNFGPSGAGIGLKDVDGATIVDNRIVNNRVGAQIDTSPREPNIEHIWRGNVFAYNQIALGLMPAVRNNTFTENAFIDNIVNLSILGGGELRDLTWAVDGRGNYWSDYVGYDADGDGIGDVPYRSQQLFESLIDSHPSLRVFMFSPASMAIDFAARAVPAVRPREKFSDPAPLMSPPAAVGLPAVERAPVWSRWLHGVAGVGGAAGVLALAGFMRRKRAVDGSLDEPTLEPQRLTAPGLPGADAPLAEDAAISVRAVTKTYGKAVAVDAVSFDIAPGEAVALWGPNGAGKTTILRCMLGIARFTGDIRVNGLNPVSDGPEARAAIGFVPQDLAPSSTPVGELASFIARLKGSTAEDARLQLARLGIDDQIAKPVSALSGGMKQRLALALALIGSPSILLLDEPTANLDAAGRASLIDLLRTLKREGMTLVFSSHRPDDVLALADRILAMERGAVTRDVGPAHFASLFDARSRLVITLSNGQFHEAHGTLQKLGYEPSGAGRVLAVPIQPGDQARVITTLVRDGIEIEDFEVERLQ